MKKTIEDLKEIGKNVRVGVSKVVLAASVERVAEAAGAGVTRVVGSLGLGNVLGKVKKAKKERKPKKEKVVPYERRETPGLVKPEWLAGSEKRFFNFIRKINEKDKIAIISHNDQDAIVAVKVATSFLKASIIKFVSHADINEDFIRSLKKEGINKIFVCDITLGNKKMLRKAEKFAKVAIVDHHQLAEDYNSPKTIFLNAQGFCAAYLCYYLFSKVQDISRLDWIVACACVADWTFVKPESWLKEIYQKYGEEFAPIENKIKSGRLWNMQYNISLAILYFQDDLNRVLNSIGENFGDIGDLEKYSKIIDFEVAKAISDFYIHKENFSDGYFMEFSLPYKVDPMIVNIMSSKTPHKTFIVARLDGEYYKLSVRRQDGTVNLPEMLKKLVDGFEGAGAGGHIPAAGAHVLIKDAEKLKERIRKL